MNACSIKGTDYEKEYLEFLNPSAVYYVWTQNNEQPLDKIKVGDEVIDNPLYQALLADPITQGNRKVALELVARTFFNNFQTQYVADADGRYSVDQVVDSIEKQKQRVRELQERTKAAINTPSSMAINFLDAEIDGNVTPIHFAPEEAQEIYDTFQFLVGYGKNWTSVFTGLTDKRNEILSRFQENKQFEGDLAKIVNLEKIIQNFDQFVDWYLSREGIVGIEELEVKNSESEDWRTKEKSQIERAGSAVIALVTALPSYRNSLSSEAPGGLVRTGNAIQLEGNLLGLPKSGDFLKNWKILSNALSGINTYNAMYDIMLNLSKQYPQFEYLLSEMPDPTVKGSTKDIKKMVLVSAFKGILSNPEVISKVIDISIKDNGEIASTMQKKGFQNVRNILSQYDGQYFLYRPKYKLIDEEGEPYLNVAALVANYGQIFRGIGAAFSKEIKIDMNLYLTDNRIATLLTFLQDLGLGLNNQDYLRATNRDLTTKFIIDNVSALTTIFQKLRVTAAINANLDPADQIKIYKPLSYIIGTDTRTFPDGRKIPRTLDITKVGQASMNDVELAEADDLIDKIISFSTTKEEALNQIKERGYEVSSLQEALVESFIERRIAGSETTSFKNWRVDVSSISQALKKVIADKVVNYNVIKATAYLQKKETELNPFTKFFSNFEVESRPTAYTTAEQKKKFIRSPWSFMTQQAAAVNKAKSYEELISQPAYARFDYRKNPDMLGSIWLNRLFGLPLTKAEIEKNPLSSYTKVVDKTTGPRTINVTDFGGLELKNFESDNYGGHTTNLHPGDKVLQDVISFFQSTELENLRYGDKTAASSTSFSNPILAEKIYVPINIGLIQEPVTDIPVEPELVNAFKNYLISEVTRISNAIEEGDTAVKTTYNKNARNLFIFNDILPADIVQEITQASTKEALIVGYHKAVAALPQSLADYFAVKGAELTQNIVDILSTPVNLFTGQNVSEGERLRQTAASLTRLNMINAQLLPAADRKKTIVITSENLPYLAQVMLKNAFINNVEFLKFFIGDMSNFSVKADYRDLFKRPAFSASPGSPVFWDAALQDFFDADIWQDALSVAYTGVENKFNPIVRTVIYKDVLTFSKSDFDKYKQVYDSGNWDSLTAEEKSEFDAYVNNPKEADAQGVVTLDFYRNYLISIGRWDADKQEKAYQQQVRIAEINQELTKNPTNSQDLIKEKTKLINSTGLSPFPPLKLGHYGPTERDPKQVALHKFSLIPMIPSVVEGRQMEKQMIAMYNGQVNYFTFKSGSKMSDNAEPSDFYSKVTRNGVEYLEVNPSIDDSLVTTIHIENLREQQYQAPKYKDESTLATQMMKLLFGDFYEFGELSQDFSPETQENIGNLYNQFKGQLNNLVQFEVIKLEKKLGITRTNGVIDNVNQLQLARFIAEQFEEKEVSEGLRNYIKVDDAGNFVNPLDANNDRAEIESLILNIFNNKIISQKINGESFIQAASTGLERLRFANPTQEQLEAYGANSLKFYRLNPTTGETDPMEVMIAFNPKKHGSLLNLTYENKRIGTLQMLNSILTSDTQAAISWRELHKDKLTMVGVRIPVQGFSSMEYAVVKEFLPEDAGAVMILPAQIVTKTGGDYDIDKLTFFMTALDESGEIIQKEFDVQEYTDQLSRQKELKISAARLKAIQQEMRAEIGNNPIYQQRQEIKDDIMYLNAEIDELLEGIHNLLVTESVTQDEADVLVGIRKEKKQIGRKFAELAKLDRENPFEALSILSEVRQDIREIKNEIAVVENFKKSLGNELINTIKGVLKTGELYDSLTTPNNNSILTQYVKPGKKITSTDVFNPMTSWRIFLENILSKDALGIDAKINTLQKEFQRAGLTYTSSLFNSYYFRANKNTEGQIMLGGKKDALGENRISKVLSEFVNGHVDIANEDWIILLGLNEETSPLAHAMILAGTPVEDVLNFINSDVIKLALTMSDRSEIHKKMSDIFVSKNSAILALIKNNISKTGNQKLEKFVAGIEAEIKTAGIKGAKPKLAIYIEKMLGIPTLNQYITNFNPTAALSQEDKAMRNIAYLLQFGVVVAQQSGLRELTSISDFNTTNYRTSFQSTDTVAKEGGLKENFNADAIDFMFNQSALAQFNVSGFVQEIMGKIYPLSDSTEVHETINTFLTKNDIVGQEARIKAIKTLKTNLIFNYTQQTASNENGNLLEYYRGKNGVMQKTNPNNLAKRFEVLISNPDFNRNYVVQNLYPETSLSGELNFKLKNIVMAETNKLYRTAFLEGLNSSIPEVKEFFTDLALGSFMQYGGHFNSDNVSSIVPYEAYIDYTTKSHNELDKMRKEEPTKFKSYLTLVRYASKMYSTTATPITTSIEFLARTNPEKLKTMRLQNSVIKSLITLERSVYSPQSIQPSTSEVVADKYLLYKKRWRKINDYEDLDISEPLKIQIYLFPNDSGFLIDLYYKEILIGQFHSYFDSEEGMKNDVEIAKTFRNKGLGKILLLIANDVSNSYLGFFESDVRGLTIDQKRVYNSLISNGQINSNLEINYEKSQELINKILKELNNPTQPSTSISEFDLADTLPPIEQNFKDGTGGRKMQPQFKGKSTMDLIISGDRTRTTRAKTDIQRMAKDYGLSKISDLVGKVIRMTDKTGRQVYTTITNVVPFTQEYQDATWQNEGWEKSVTDKHVGDYPYAIEFKVVDKPTQPSNNPNQDDINNLPNINPCG